MFIRKNNIVCRHHIVDRRFAFCSLIMRLCNQYFFRDFSCKISLEHDFCENCFRSTRKCDLTSNLASMNKIIRENEKLNQEILKLKQKIVRFRTLRRYWRRKLRELDDKESANLLKLKKEEHKKMKRKKMIFSFNFVDDVDQLFSFEKLQRMFNFFSQIDFVDVSNTQS